jgi:hypothetical protein
MKLLRGGMLVVMLGVLTLAFAGHAPLPGRESARLALPHSQAAGRLIPIWQDPLNNGEPTVAYNSRHGEYLVAWTTRHGPDTRDIWARRVRADGQLLDSFNIATLGSHYCYQPRAAYSPAHDEYLVVYTCWQGFKNYDVLARRVRWDGMVASSPVITIAGTPQTESYAAVAYNSQDDEYLVVWTHQWGVFDGDLRLRRVRAGDGEPLAEAQLPNRHGEARAMPVVAYNPVRNQYLLVYLFELTGPADVRANLVSNDLSTFGPDLRLWEHTEQLHALPPAVSAGDDEYLIVWPGRYLHAPAPSAEKMDVYARRVSGDGMPQGTAGRLIATGAGFDMHYSPAVAHVAGNGYLAAVCYARSKAWDADTYGRYLMAGADEPAGNAFVIDNSQGKQTDPAVACAPDGTCLVVEASETDPKAGPDIVGRLVSPGLMAGIAGRPPL